MDPETMQTEESLLPPLEEAAEFLKPHFLSDFFQSQWFPKTVSALVTIAAFWLLYRVIRRIIRRVPETKLPPQSRSAVEKAVKYILFLFCAFYLLGIFGVKLTALLGAAGIAGIAVGFAAQTSFSNIISGFFFLSEKTVKVGDYITVDTIAGTVDSVDLLSVKIHTPDNQLVRIPNETIIKSNLQNSTYFPIRRLSVSVSVAYDTPLEKAAELLLQVPPRCPEVLKEPAPAVYFEEFGDSGIGMRLAVWLKSDQYWEVRNAVFTEIKKTFDENGISIPFPQLDVHCNSVTPL